MSFAIENQLRVISFNGAVFFASRSDNDLAIGSALEKIATALDLRRSGHGGLIAPQAWLHGNIVRLLWAVREIGAAPQNNNASSDAKAISDACRDLTDRLVKHCASWRVNDITHWYSGIVFEQPHLSVFRALTSFVEETIQELRTLAGKGFSVSVPLSAGNGNGCVEDYVPASVLALRTEAFLPMIWPWFQKALAVPGDIAEFGCFKGTMSIKYAFYIQGLKQAKTVYAFDTFEGFAINDPGGGALGIGAYADHDNAYEELGRWSKAIPIVPVKGDATQTCKILAKPLSFVWLDLDMGVLMEPVLQHIRGLCGRDTIIGVDDYGRPETPTVKPWADETETRETWEKIAEYPESCIAFYRISGKG